MDGNETLSPVLYELHVKIYNPVSFLSNMLTRTQGVCWEELAMGMYLVHCSTGQQVTEGLLTTG